MKSPSQLLCQHGQPPSLGCGSCGLSFNLTSITEQPVKEKIRTTAASTTPSCCCCCYYYYSTTTTSITTVLLVTTISTTTTTAISHHFDFWLCILLFKSPICPHSLHIKPQRWTSGNFCMMLQTKDVKVQKEHGYNTLYVFIRSMSYDAVRMLVRRSFLVPGLLQLTVLRYIWRIDDLVTVCSECCCASGVGCPTIYDHISPVLHQLHWLPVRMWVDF